MARYAKKIMERLMELVVINDESQDKAMRDILRQQAKAFTFPLNDDDKSLIRKLEGAFDSMDMIAGLAAPQIGIARQAIIFKVPAAIKRWRTDVTQEVEKTIWLNPRYRAADKSLREDYEACFSVAGYAGLVPRFTKIIYEAHLLDGSKVEGIALGYLARVIQHEVDHIQGKLFIDRVPVEKLLTMDEYKRLRDEKMNES
jgi:peptide deformylase